MLIINWIILYGVIYCASAFLLGLVLDIDIINKLLAIQYDMTFNKKTDTSFKNVDEFKSVLIKIPILNTLVLIFYIIMLPIIISKFGN